MSDRIRRWVTRIRRWVTRIRRWVTRENARDVWLVAITGLTVWMLATALSLAGRVGSNQARDTAALCALRSDLETRASSGEAFLAAHPHGIPGISAPTINAALTNERHTLRALAPVLCPAPAPHKPKHPH